MSLHWLTGLLYAPPRALEIPCTESTGASKWKPRLLSLLYHQELHSRENEAAFVTDVFESAVKESGMGEQGA